MKKILFLLTMACMSITLMAQERKILDVAEISPSFPGGYTAMKTYLNDSIRYPMDAYESGIAGIVVIKMVVEADGSITNAKVVRSVSPSLDAEALRVVLAMPKWIPAQHNGRAVPVYYNLPVRFKIQ